MTGWSTPRPPYTGRARCSTTSPATPTAWRCPMSASSPSAVTMCGLRVRADATGGKRCVRIDGHTFLTHVLPKGYKRIRHYGWLGPAPNPIAIEQAAEFMASAWPKSISIAAGTAASAAGASCRRCTPHSAAGQRRPSPPPVPHPDAMPRPTVAIPIPSRSAPVPRSAPYGCFTVSCHPPRRCTRRRPAHLPPAVVALSHTV